MTSSVPPAAQWKIRTEPVEGSFASDSELIATLTGYLPKQRWFASKSEGPEPVLRARRPIAERSGVTVEQVVIQADPTEDGDLYQLWIGWTRELPDRLGQALIGRAGDLLAYDALADHSFTDHLLSLIADGAQLGELVFSAEPDARIDTAASGHPLSGEQSNTSIVYGHSAILKVFRRLSPGPNPDLEVHRALHALGCARVAAPLGVIEGPVAGESTTLALLTAFFNGGADGWAMATHSVRDLLAEGDLRADEVGGDFAAEAHRLGQAVATVHADLATAFGTAQPSADAVAELTEHWVESTTRTAAQVPALAPLLPAILDIFAAAGEAILTEPMQRIHGDLHLGQTLRVIQGWAIIDFEGEPDKPIAYRRARHSPLRDVAGMLRSFDYAAHHSLTGGQGSAQQQYRAAEWARRNSAAFCDGYAAVAGQDPRVRRELLTAFELEKAVYEVGYEHAYRPTWEPIPLQAVSRLTGNGGSQV